MEERKLEEQLDEKPEQKETAAPKKKNPKKTRRTLVVLIVLLCIILVAELSIGLYVNYLLDRVGDYDPSLNATISPDQVGDIIDKDPGLAPVDPNEKLPGLEEITPPTGGQSTGKKRDVINILIVGQDSENANIRTRSDSMIMVTIHTKAKQVTLTSFMRDAYVMIPGYAPDKLNHAYQFGGLKLLNATLNENYGVKIDGNVVINFSSFMSIIDMIGGVDINLNKAEAKYLSEAAKHDVHEGMNRLTALQALDYARLREIDSDYQRTSRQRKVILSIIERYKTLPVDQMLALLDDILPLIVTDMDKTQILEYAVKCAPIAATASYGTQQIPANGTFLGGYVEVREGLKNWFQYDIDFGKNRDILQKIMNGNK